MGTIPILLGDGPGAEKNLGAFASEFASIHKAEPEDGIDVYMVSIKSKMSENEDF